MLKPGMAVFDENAEHYDHRMGWRSVTHTGQGFAALWWG